jgi:hypothetical protein
LSSDSTVRPSTQPKKGKGLCALLRELSDDEDELVCMGLHVLEDLKRSWLRNYHAYINVLKQMPEGWMAIQWWSVSI